MLMNIVYSDHQVKDGREAVNIYEWARVYRLKNTLRYPIMLPDVYRLMTVIVEPCVYYCLT